MRTKDGQKKSKIMLLKYHTTTEDRADVRGEKMPEEIRDGDKTLERPAGRRTDKTSDTSSRYVERKPSKDSTYPAEEKPDGGGNYGKGWMN